MFAGKSAVQVCQARITDWVNEKEVIRIWNQIRNILQPTNSSPIYELTYCATPPLVTNICLKMESIIIIIIIVKPLWFLIKIKVKEIKENII